MFYWFQVISFVFSYCFWGSCKHLTFFCFSFCFYQISLFYFQQLLLIVILGFLLLMTTFFKTGSSLSDKVNQSPAEMIHNQEETAKIHCSHSIQDYNYIFWYKLTEDRQMKFLGYMFMSNDNPEAGSGVKLDGSASKDQTCTLTMEGLGLSSSAVYFCAASLHSESCRCSSVQKPAHVTADWPESCFFLLSRSELWMGGSFCGTCSI